MWGSEMTYLELVNGVLMRLREKPALTVHQQSDAVINMTKTLVNDAKRHVEASHRWTGLETTWLIENRSVFAPTVMDGRASPAIGKSGKIGDVAPPPDGAVPLPDGEDSTPIIPPSIGDKDSLTAMAIGDYDLLGTENGCSVTNVFNEQGAILTQAHPDQIAKWRLIDPEKVGHACNYSIVGRRDKRGYALRVWPNPARDIVRQDVLTVRGYRTTGDLKSDDDELMVPSQPVLYYALALAARERGEVGGQTAQEIFAMAGNYISDAIANDFNVTPFGNTWVAV